MMIGIVAAVAILTRLPTLVHVAARVIVVLTAAGVFFFFFWGSSFRFVGENDVGVVIKNIGAALPPGQIIATDGEMGPQAKILGPGWHPLLWPVIYNVESQPVTEIQQGEVGIITTTDGKPLPPGEIYAREWTEDEFQQMLLAEHFLGAGGGYKAPQASVLTPGKYRINPKLYRIEKMLSTNIAKATVGIVKSNVGEPGAKDEQPTDALVDSGMRGIWRQPLLPQIYYLNTKALEVTDISTAKKVVRYVKGGSQGEEQEITVRSADGFTFPVDVRVEYEVLPQQAALIVANFGDDGTVLQDRLNSAVRAIFRNNAETLRALDYVQQRSAQETQSLALLATEMEKVGLTVTAVRIGDVGDEQSLGLLLKTQTDREIAVQEQKTFEEQQRTAEQQKKLSKTEQEAKEEMRLATAMYEVQIASAEKEKKVIGAEAEAEAIQIRAKAQAEAFRVVSEQIGAGNAALIEVMTIVGENQIPITPRVMVSGGNAGNPAGDETTALIGTMIDTMIQRDVVKPAAPAQP